MPQEKAKTEYGTTSKRAQQLLARQEGYDVEFKESQSALKNESLVAFANSEQGGAILIGVREVVVNGVQRGEIIGCPVGDGPRQKIQNRAHSCVWPVPIEIVVENLNRKAFLRVEIPSGPEKPYCTAGGRYRIRGDGRNKALLPGDLLAMFLANERDAFIERFRAATDHLQTEVEGATKALYEQLSSLRNTVVIMDREVSELVGRAIDAAETAGANAEEVSMQSMHESSELNEELRELTQLVWELDERVGLVIKNFEIDDPVERMREARAEAHFEEMESFAESFLEAEGLQNQDDNDSEEQKPKHPP